MHWTFNFGYCLYSYSLHCTGSYQDKDTGAELKIQSGQNKTDEYIPIKLDKQSGTNNI
jgi:hypothetical protein